MAPRQYTTVLASPPRTTVLSAGQGPAGPPGVSGGQFLSATAAVPVGGHLALRPDATGKLVPADVRDPLGATVMGVSIGAAGADSQVPMVNTGSLEHIGWSFTPNLPVYLGIDGQLVQSIAVGALFQKVLGIATSPTRVNLVFQPTIFNQE